MITCLQCLYTFMLKILYYFIPSHTQLFDGTNKYRQTYIEYNSRPSVEEAYLFLIRVNE